LLQDSDIVAAERPYCYRPVTTETAGKLAGKLQDGSGGDMAPPKSARNRSVGTKLTEEEYARLEAAVGKSGLTVGEWCRMELLRGAGETVGNGHGDSTNRDAIPILAPIAEGNRPATATEETLLAEVLALRTILLNLFYDLAQGQAMTTERMQELIGKADGEKRTKAAARLKAPPIEGAA
jgi:hypothetical protein